MTVSVGRRTLLIGATAVACSRSERASGEPPPLASNNVRILEWNLGPQPWGQARVVLVVPTWAATDALFPVLVALHGRGESLKPPAEGAMGWPRDYAMVRAIDRLRSPPLREPDYEGFVDPPRLAETNASLAANPFRGLVVVCPWLPDLRPAATADIAAYSHFLTDTLLPRVHAETPALRTPEATGIDGVSLGGIAALRIGLTCPQRFGAVGGIQPAIGDGQYAEWTALAQAARALRPGLRLRLMTSREDYFREAVTALSAAWRAGGIAHDFTEGPGPHDYVFNRGPGSIELLLWHDRALAHA